MTQNSSKEKLSAILLKAGASVSIERGTDSNVSQEQVCKSVIDSMVRIGIISSGELQNPNK